MPATTPRSVALADPELRRALTRAVRARASEADVEDIVQATLVDAIAAERAPEDPDELRKWVFGIARHKIADHHRKASKVELTGEPPEAEATSAPHGAEDLVRWVEAELPEDPGAKKTLEWMAREAEGDKLEAIAAEENLPAPRVRQRVWRLRRFFRERWAAALAVTALVIVAGIAFWSTLSRTSAPAPVASSRSGPSPLDRARVLREAALERCGAGAFGECVQGLDAARALDPVGDEAEAVQEARASATRGQAPTAPSASASAGPAPEPSAAPTPAPRPTATSSQRQKPRRYSSDGELLEDKK